MDKKYFDIAFLIGKYLTHGLSLSEQEQLEKWLDLSEENRAWFNKITSETYQNEKNTAIRQIDIQRGWQALQTKRKTEKTSIRAYKHYWLRYAGGIAATIAILFGAITLFQMNRPAVKHTPIRMKIADIKVPTVIEFQGNDEILSYDSLEIKKSDRIYIASKQSPQTQNAINIPASAINYKTVVIPAGYTYQVQLADGSKVTLNAGSTLKFPDRFQDTLREVELTGEGYFEVNKAACPFVVKTGKTHVTVYGTRFNLFFSEKLQLTEAVLIEGSIGMTADHQEIKITPNQRIYHLLDSHITRVEEVNPTEYTSWLENSFKYNKKPLQRIVFDISQWYGIEIKLTPNVVNENYSLEFDKSVSVEWTLRALEKIIDKDIKKEGGVYYIE